MKIFRGFEKLTGEGSLPRRATKKAAGYDFRAYVPDGHITIPPGETRMIGTDITAYMQDDEVLLLFVRSGLAAKLGMTLQDAVDVVDADYYGKEIKFLLSNEGPDTVVIRNGDRIGQGIFTKYLLADDDVEGADGGEVLRG